MAREVQPVIVFHLAPGERTLDVVIVVESDPELLEVAHALGPAWPPPRAACTAGNSRAIKTAMIAITTKPFDERGRASRSGVHASNLQSKKEAG